MNNLLAIKDITKTYVMGEVTVHALRGISFDITKSEFITILGPSGSGKSTLLNIIGGIDTPTQGTILYKGKDITKFQSKELTTYRRTAIGFVFQFYNLIPNLTVKENVLLAANLSASPMNTDELLEKISLADRSNHFPSQLSGGQQQRVAIARAIAKNPDILLCDEPTGALDVKTGVQVLEILKDFQQTYRKTVVIITHNSAIAQLSNRVFHIRDGLLEKIKINTHPLPPEEVAW